MSEKSIGTCPRCGGQIVEKTRVWGCENPDCKVFWTKDNKYFSSMGKELTEAMLVKMLAGEEVFVEGLRSKKGNLFDAYISMRDPGEGYMQFVMRFPEKVKEKTS